MKLFYLQEFNHLLHHSCSDGLLNNFQRGRKGAAENASSSLSEAERKGGRGKKRVGRYGVQTPAYKINKLQGFAVHCREHSQYFIITMNGTPPLKIVSHYAIHLKLM